MAQKTVTVIRSSCVRCGGSTGPEVISGDTVKLWLDQDANGNFPPWVEAQVIIVHPQSDVNNGPWEYTVEYESDDLDGSASMLRDCDIKEVTCIGCCAIINEYLDLMAGINVPNINFFYQWNEDNTLTLTARAWSTQIAGNPGEQVTITEFIFTDPSSIILPKQVGDENHTRTITPAGQDWPGGLFNVQVTDSEGLINEASVWVAARRHYRTITVVLGVGLTTVDSGIDPDKEEIVSVMAVASESNMYQFSTVAATPNIIAASGPAVANTTLKVLVRSA